ncbi:hypothetical protein OUZ56_022002 [Daphnia magna]|uniref:Uncharacterized protein n=1 Tax=Daphnia magna TaxID=35525 RepID=A0ABR0AV32_9CRUS|nr:hypothetical protein OUZ56_022002 [Daphnia magna]
MFPGIFDDAIIRPLVLFPIQNVRAVRCKWRRRGQYQVKILSPLGLVHPFSCLKKNNKKTKKKDVDRAALLSLRACVARAKLLVSSMFQLSETTGVLYARSWTTHETCQEVRSLHRATDATAAS